MLHLLADRANHPVLVHCDAGDERTGAVVVLSRHLVEGKLVITIDMREKCLLLYPLPAWEVVQRKLEDLSNMAPRARLLQRLLIGHATAETPHRGRPWFV